MRPVEHVLAASTQAPRRIPRLAVFLLGQFGVDEDAQRPPMVIGRRGVPDTRGKLLVLRVAFGVGEVLRDGRGHWTVTEIDPDNASSAVVRAKMMVAMAR